MDQSSSPATGPDTSFFPRRSFFNWLTYALGALAAAILGAPLLGFFLGSRSKSEKMITLGPVKDFLPTDPTDEASAQTRMVTFDNPNASPWDGVTAQTSVFVRYEGVDFAQQKLILSATGGTFTMTFEGQSTSAVAYNATDAILQTDLAALSTIGSGNISVTGAAGGPYVIKFVGALAGLPQPLITTNAARLTGGAGTATISQIQRGKLKFMVVTVNCAHLGCPVSWFPQSGLFMCPCHGGVYYANGEKASGPPPRGLFRCLPKIEDGLLKIQAPHYPTLQDGLDRDEHARKSGPKTKCDC